MDLANQLLLDKQKDELKKQEVARQLQDKNVPSRPPDWAEPGSRKFTDWSKKSPDKLEKNLVEMMIPMETSEGDRRVSTSDSGLRQNSKREWDLAPELDRQVKVLKRVLKMKPTSSYITEAEVGWNNEGVIWMLLPFEKTYYPSFQLQRTDGRVRGSVLRTQAMVYLTVCPRGRRKY
jgi:hypothetical protein